MCDPGTLIGLAATLAGSAVQHFSQSAALHRQDQAAAQAIRNQRVFQSQANQAVQDQVKAVQPDERQQNRQQAEQTLDQSFTDAIQRGADQAALSEGNSAGGDLSDAYKVSRANAVADQTQQAIDRARLQAQILAPDQARMLEGFGIADTAARLGEIGGDARGQAGADQILFAQAGQQNPYLSAIGQALSGFGQGKMLGSTYGTKAASSATPTLTTGRGFNSGFSF